MDFLKKHIEKVVFGVLAAVFAVSVIVALNGSDPSALANIGISPPPRSAEDQDLSRVDRMLASISDAPARVEVSQNAFTSHVRRECINLDDRSLIPLDAEICPYCGVKQTGVEPVDEHGIPQSLYLKWGLNFGDPNEVKRVLDGSGFTVLHQWKSGCDPLDPNSIPPLIEFLRIQEMDEQSVKIELRGIAEITTGVYMLQLRWLYPGESRWEDSYVRVGNRFGRKNEFLAAAFTERRVQENGLSVDRSFAEIRSGRNVLRLSRDGDDSKGAISERSAVLGLYMGPSWSKTVRRDETFELQNISYMVVDIRQDAVVIRAADAEETITIQRATPQELESAKPPAPEGSIPGSGGFQDPGLNLDPSMFFN